MDDDDDGLAEAGRGGAKGGCFGSLLGCVRGAAPDGGKGLCLESAGSVTTTNWNYVGDGRGAYRKVPQYTYVGEGRGSFEMEQVPVALGWRLRRQCLCFFSLALVGGFVCIVVYRQLRRWRGPPPAPLEPLVSRMATWWPGLAATGAATASAADRRAPDGAGRSSTLRPLYRCALSRGVDFAEAAWRDADADRSEVVDREELWTSERSGRLRSPELAILRTSDLDGDGALSHAEFIAALAKAASVEVVSWSAAKRAWCCEHEAVGCTSTAAPSHRPFDCSLGEDNWASEWSCDKKEWCCKHASRFCETTTFPAYDCEARYDSWELGWSDAKKSWCCANFGRGCPVTTTAVEHDCQVGGRSVPHAWPASKQEWCCRHEGRGCEAASGLRPAPPAEQFDCAAAIENWELEWSDGKKAWCCEHHRVGCDLPGPRAPAHVP